MNIFLLAKFLHIVGVTMMVGATLCNGIIHYNAMNDRSIENKVTSLHNIMRINQVIMIPGFILLVFNGLFMLYQSNISAELFWLKSSIIITAILIIEFLWGYLLEKKLLNLSKNSITKKAIDFNKKYKSILIRAVPIGSSAGILSLLAVYLMVIKPS